MKSEQSSQTLTKLSLIMKKFTLAFFFFSMFFATPIVAQDYELRFDIVNKTEINLYGIYVTDVNTGGWGNDIIPNDMFEHDTVVTVSIDVDNNTLCEYDIRITDDSEDSVEFSDVDFCELETLTLLMDNNGDLYYTVE